MPDIDEAAEKYLTELLHRTENKTTNSIGWRVILKAFISEIITAARLQGAREQREKDAKIAEALADEWGTWNSERKESMADGADKVAAAIRKEPL